MSNLPSVTRRDVLRFTGASALAMGGLGFAATPAAAAHEVLIAEVEGPLTAVNASGHTLTVFGQTVSVPDETPISSPTANGLTLADLSSAPAFPGRSDPGFINGTVIVEAETDETGTPIRALNVFVEIAEHVIVGAVTKNDATGFEVLGVPVVLLEGDSRMPSRVVSEGTNIAIDLATVPTGTLAAVEGYFAGGTLHAHTIEAQGTAQGEATLEITRTRCKSGNRLEVRGVSSELTGTVTIFDNATNAQLGTASVVNEGTGVGEFVALLNVTCPEEVRVVHNNGAWDVAEVQ